MLKNCKGVYIIWLRDLKRYWYDKPRMLGSLGQAALFLFVLGTGLSASGLSKIPNSPMAKGIQFFYPGIIAMTILFTSIFSAMSIVWDREFGFLKEVLVAPISRISVALGKALGGTTIAMIQATIMLVFAPMIGISLSVEKILILWLIMFITAFSMTSIGIVFAVRIKSMEGFQMVMNLFLMPVFLLSGALYDIRNLPSWLSYLVLINPLTYSVDMLRSVTIGEGIYPLFQSFLILIVFSTITMSVAIYMFSLKE